MLAVISLNHFITDRQGQAERMASPKAARGLNQKKPR
jgi:hypothetical protein